MMMAVSDIFLLLDGRDAAAKQKENLGLLGLPQGTYQRRGLPLPSATALAA